MLLTADSNRSKWHEMWGVNLQTLWWHVPVTARISISGWLVMLSMGVSFSGLAPLQLAAVKASNVRGWASSPRDQAFWFFRPWVDIPPVWNHLFLLLLGLCCWGYSCSAGFSWVCKAVAFWANVRECMWGFWDEDIQRVLFPRTVCIVIMGLFSKWHCGAIAWAL
jgi:hypothetical protein